MLGKLREYEISNIKRALTPKVLIKLIGEISTIKLNLILNN